MIDLVTIPITIQSKTQKQERFYPDKFLKGYVKLRLGKGSGIYLDLIFHSTKRNYLVRISKESILDIVMYHLKLKPIYRHTAAAKPWLKEIKRVKIDTNIQTDEEIFEAYGEAVRRLQAIMPNISDLAKERAQKQWDDLMYAQRRINLVEKIIKAKEVKPSDFEEA